MSLSMLALIVYIFLQAAGGYLAWFTVSSKLLGIVGLVFVGLALLEHLGVVTAIRSRRQKPAE